jgi:hypothetical protein
MKERPCRQPANEVFHAHLVAPLAGKPLETL